jgi:hypothetical protein
MKKHVKIIGIVLIFALLFFVLAAIAGSNKNRTQRTKNGTNINSGVDGKGRMFTEKELQVANLALSKGITIDDPQNDWYKFPPGSMQPDNRPDNSNPYPLGWTDYRSLSVGVDEKYIYFKMQFWDIFPLNALIYDGDLIHSTTAKITNFTFKNSQGKIDNADFTAGPWYASFENKDKPAERASIGANAMISPKGLDKEMDTLFNTNTSESMIIGGPGYDYLICAFPLSLLNIKLGDEVLFDSAIETSSTKFHHESMDLLLGEPNSKFGSQIRYILGRDKYEIVPNPDYSKHS